MKPESRIPKPLLRRIAFQIAGMASLSLALGLIFNAANPIGIRWSQAGRPAGSERGQQPVAAAAVTSSALPPSVPAASSTAPAPAERASLAPTPALESYQSLGTIDWPSAKALLAGGKIVLIDVRGKPTYDAGHIPGAVSLPEWSTADEISAFQKQFNTNTPLALYCGNLGCPASDEMAGKLVKDYGYKQVLVMKGGYAEWQKAELGYDPTPTRTTWAETKSLVTAGQVVLVDARPKAVFEAGHIPSAISLPEASSEEEFKEFQKQHPLDQPIVVYCSDLKCAASMRVAIKLVTWYHFRKVQFMPGGFQEWQQTELVQVKPQS